MQRVKKKFHHIKAEGGDKIFHNLQNAQVSQLSIRLDQTSHQVKVPTSRAPMPKQKQIHKNLASN